MSANWRRMWGSKIQEDQVWVVASSKAQLWHRQMKKAGVKERGSQATWYTVHADSRITRKNAGLERARL